MILTCPECATRYQADASQFAPDGRKVRCAKCGHVWHQAAPPPEPEAALEDASFAAEPEAEPEAPPTREAYAPPPTPRVEPKPTAAPSRFSSGPPLLERLGFGVGWAVLAVLVLAIGWAGVRYRQNIASLWPQSSSLYAAVGMPVNTRGIEIKSGDKDAHFETENGQDVLVITGDVVNITSRELSVPPIRVSLTDADKRELYHWTFAPGVTTLNPGKSAPFRTRLPTPPVAVRHIELRFAAERAN
jgi:predicted Zn finger-like uncharacterized protein